MDTQFLLTLIVSSGYAPAWCSSYVWHIGSTAQLNRAPCLTPSQTAASDCLLTSFSTLLGCCELCAVLCTGLLMLNFTQYVLISEQLCSFSQGCSLNGQSLHALAMAMVQQHSRLPDCIFERTSDNKLSCDSKSQTLQSIVHNCIWCACWLLCLSQPYLLLDA